MRLEAMVIAGVTNRAAGFGKPFQALEVRWIIGEKRFLDEQVLAIGKEMSEQANLGLVGRAHQRCVVGIQRHVLDALVLRFGVDWINGCDGFPSGDREALLTLHPQPYYDHTHR